MRAPGAVLRTTPSPASASPAPSPAPLEGGWTPSRRRSAGARLAALLGRPWFWLLVIATLFGTPLVRSLLRSTPAAPPVLATVPSFTLLDQDGESFGSTQLAGKVWVANFIFTSCQTMCPVLTGKMRELAHRARRLGPDVHFVSFTVDPERDTPERLRAYAQKHGADPHKWAFVTGSLGDVERAVVDGFKIAIERPQPPTDLWEIVHGEHFVLVDRGLNIRGYFTSDAQGMDRLVFALGQVASEPGVGISRAQ